LRCQKFFFSFFLFCFDCLLVIQDFHPPPFLPSLCPAFGKYQLDDKGGHNLGIAGFGTDHFIRKTKRGVMLVGSVRHFWLDGGRKKINPIWTFS
jgi:hypothetical protein